MVVQLRPCGTVIVYGILAGWEITVPMGPLFKVSQPPEAGYHCVAICNFFTRCRLRVSLAPPPAYATVGAQMRRVAGWGLFDYLPSLGPEGQRAFLQEIWEHFLDGTFKSYVGQPPS